MASRNINDLNKNLADCYLTALKEYEQLHPDLPQPFITCTHRSNAEQAALYAQGRQSAIVVNDLRKKAGMLPISMSEAKRKVTNAKPGSSYHNRYLSEAFDIAFIDSRKKLDWSAHLFKKFADIILKLNTNITWGGNFRTIKDAPHFQIELK
jgi:hypothetical protein